MALSGLGQEVSVQVRSEVSQQLRQLIDEFARFGVIGVAGLFIANAVYDLLYIHLGVGPVTFAPPASAAGDTQGQLGPARPPQTAPNPHAEAHAGAPGDGPECVQVCPVARNRATQTR